MIHSHLNVIRLVAGGIRLRCAQYTTSLPPPKVLLCENICHSIPQFCEKEDIDVLFYSTVHKASIHRNNSCIATLPLVCDIGNIHVRDPADIHLLELSRAATIDEISILASMCFETAC